MNKIIFVLLCFFLVGLPTCLLAKQDPLLANYNKTVKIHLTKGDTAQCLKAFCLFYSKEYEWIRNKTFLFEDLLPVVLGYRKTSLQKNTYYSQFTLLFIAKYYFDNNTSSKAEKYAKYVETDISTEGKEAHRGYELEVFRLLKIYFYNRLAIIKYRNDCDIVSSISLLEKNSKDIETFLVEFRKKVPNFRQSRTVYRPIDKVVKYCVADAKTRKTENLLNGLMGLQDFTYLDLGQRYLEFRVDKDNEAKALFYLKKVKNQAKQYGIEYTAYYYNLYLYLLRKDKETDDFQRTLRGLEQTYRDANSKHKGYLCQILCSTYNDIRDYHKTIQLSSESLKITKNQDRNVLLQILYYRANAFTDLKQSEEAVITYNRLIQLYFSPTTTYQGNNYPAIKEGDNASFVIYNLHAKLFNLIQLPKREKEALELAYYLDRSFHFIRSSALVNESKLEMIAAAVKFYQNVIQFCYKLGKPTDAYYFMERSRAMLLDESLRKANKSSKDTSFLGISQLQARLATNQTYVSYFVSDSTVYAFWVNKTKVMFKELPISSQRYTTLSNQLLRLCSQTATQNGKVSPKLVEKIQKEYPAVANALYRALVVPLDIPPHSRVILSSNKPILPFAALMVSEKGFDSKNYLVHQYSFSYAYSANLLFNAPFFKKPEVQQQLLAVYPKDYGTTTAAAFATTETTPPKEENFFVLASDKLLSLIERGSITKILGQSYFGKVLKSDQATKAFFLKEIKNSQIAYFFTHAQAEQASPTLYFQSDSLTLNDIYALQGKIATDLVCFAACETGIGKEAVGEGVMSLARGFAYVGVPATISTLWRVFSNYTDELYQVFFDNMSQKEPKDVALKKAQIVFLDKATQHAQLPMAWASLVLIGNTEPILPTSAPDSSLKIAIACGVVFLLLYRKRLLFINYFRRR